MSYTNYDIVPAALEGKTRASQNGNFSTTHTTGGLYWAGWNTGHLPRSLASILSARSAHITQIIYSYSTPIAWLDSGTWVVPDVSYSITTSSRHATHLWRLPNRVSVNADTTLNEYLRVLDGRMVYAGDRTVPGPNFVLA